MELDRKVIRELALVIPLDDRLYVYADRGGRLDEVVDERSVSAACLLQRSDGQDRAVLAQPQGPVGLEKVKDPPLDVPSVRPGELVNDLF